jgi:hypothetical protein
LMAANTSLSVWGMPMNPLPDGQSTREREAEQRCGEGVILVGYVQCTRLQ